jgi:hypothetical protein
VSFRRLAAVLVIWAAATGFVGAVPAAAQQAPANETGCNTFDATGDTEQLDSSTPQAEPRADVTQLCVDYGYALRVVVVVAQPTDPSSDPGWGDGGDSRVDLGFDTDNDPDLELMVSADGEDYALVRDAADRPVCTAPFFALPTGYAMELSRNCLGADTVAVSAVMVYDPSPTTAGPLVADLAPDAGFVPRVSRSAPAIPQPLADAAAPVCMADEENDTIDEASRPVIFDAADIVETCVQHGSTELRLTARMRRPTDPQAEPIWLSRSGVGWDLDTDNDLEEDFNVSFTDTGGRAYSTDAESAADFCEATPGFDGTLLILHFPRTCLGTPGFVAARPFSIFARTAQVEPQPPLAIDLYRFPGFSALVGAPGVQVPVQATPSGGTPAAPSAPAAPGTPGGVGSTVTTTVSRSTGSTSTTATGRSSGAAVTQTAARSSSALASTGAFLDPAVWATGLVAVGLGLVGLSRRRVVLEAAGQWDLLPAPRRQWLWRGRARG